MFRDGLDRIVHFRNSCGDILEFFLSARRYETTQGRRLHRAQLPMFLQVCCSVVAPKFGPIRRRQPANQGFPIADRVAFNVARRLYAFRRTHSVNPGSLKRMRSVIQR
jgi:hypothetical protein